MKTLVSRLALLSLVLVMFTNPSALRARTVYHCVQNNSSSLSTAPEPGSRCRRFDIDDNSAMPYAKFGISEKFRNDVPKNSEKDVMF